MKYFQNIIKNKQQVKQEHIYQKEDISICEDQLEVNETINNNKSEKRSLTFQFFKTTLLKVLNTSKKIFIQSNNQLDDLSNTNDDIQNDQDNDFQTPLKQICPFQHKFIIDSDVTHEDKNQKEKQNQSQFEINRNWNNKYTHNFKMLNIKKQYQINYKLFVQLKDQQEHNYYKYRQCIISYIQELMEGLQLDYFHKAIHLFDILMTKYLGNFQIIFENLKNFIVVIVYIVCKMYSLRCYSASLTCLSQVNMTKQEFIKLEHLILNKLEWNVNPCTLEDITFCILQEYLKIFDNLKDQNNIIEYGQTIKDKSLLQIKNILNVIVYDIECLQIEIKILAFSIVSNVYHQIYIYKSIFLYYIKDYHQFMHHETLSFLLQTAILIIEFVYYKEQQSQEGLQTILYVEVYPQFISNVSITYDTIYLLICMMIIQFRKRIV